MHHHFHILLPLLALLQGQVYLELGTYKGESLWLATRWKKLKKAISVDNYRYFTPAQVRKNVGPCKADLVQYQSLTNNRDTLRKLYSGETGVAPHVDLLLVDASHKYQNVLEDFANYYPLVRAGGVILFDDYNDNVHSPEVKPAVHALLKKYPELHVIGVLPNNSNSYGKDVPLLAKQSNLFIVQKPYPKPVQRDEVAIVLASYPRGDDTVLQKTLSSLAQQEYQNWRLYFTGDHYPNDQIKEVITKIIPLEKLVYNNLPVACEREFLTSKKALHCLAGSTAMNYSLKVAGDHGHLYCAHLDDDDYWYPNHLSVLMKAYTENRNLATVHTRGKWGELILPRNPTPYPDHNTLHSTVSWRLDLIPLFYNNRPERLFAADALMWKALKKYCLEHDLQGAECPEITMLYNHHLNSIKGK